MKNDPKRLGPTRRLRWGLVFGLAGAGLGLAQSPASAQLAESFTSPDTVHGAVGCVVRELSAVLRSDRVARFGDDTVATVTVHRKEGERFADVEIATTRDGATRVTLVRGPFAHNSRFREARAAIIEACRLERLDA